MTVDHSIRDLLKALGGADSFEDAADRLLSELLEGRAEPRPSRGWVHLRDASTYRGVVGRTRRHVEVQDDAPSWTAGRAALSSGRIHVLDVERSELRPVGERQAARVSVLPADFRSRDSLLARRVRTVMALPFTALGGVPAGFVSLEWTTALGEGDIEVLADELPFIVALSAPFVSGLPRRQRLPISPDPFMPVVGAALQPLLNDLRCFAHSPDKILLTGETGVGKSYLARWCHAQSGRRDGPFERFTVRGDNAQMQAGELFGWAKGAFTGADGARVGLIERATGGTLFIDEIDKLSLDGQTGLLGLLDDGHYRRLGESQTRTADVRFIIGTNADLRAEVEAGRFMRDLYYRIAELPLHVPPLRERRNEIGDWAEVFVRRADQRRDTDQHEAGPVTVLDAGARHHLQAHDWPGNLRELSSVIKRAYALVDRRQAGGPLIGEALIRRALSPELPASHRLLDIMRTAASAFVEVATERSDGLPIEHTQAFKGFVLDVGVTRLGERAFFEKVEPSQLKSSNHLKVLRRERKHIAALKAFLEDRSG